MAKQDTPKKKSNLKKLLLLIPILLVVAVAVNFKTIVQLAKGERTLIGVMKGATESGYVELAGFPMPEDIGSEDAKVTIEIFFRAGDPCQVDSGFTGQALGKIDPDRVRIDFQNTAEQESAKRFAKLKMGCEQAIAINGKTKFTVPVSALPVAQGEAPGHVGLPTATAPEPSAEATAEPVDQKAAGRSGKAERTEKVIYFTGGTHWQIGELYAVLNQELEKEYDGKGIGMSFEEFRDRATAEAKRLREAALAEVKAKKEAEGKSR